MSEPLSARVIRPGPRHILGTRSLNSLNSLQRVGIEPPAPSTIPPIPPTNAWDTADTPIAIEILFKEFLKYATTRGQNQLVSELATETNDENPPPAVRIIVSSLPNTTQQPRRMKRSYPREYKLKAIQYYHTAVVESVSKPGVFGKISKRLASKKLGITPAMLRDWLSKEVKIQESLKGTRWIGCGRKIQWPELESRLFTEFSECRARGQSINHHWFLRTAKRLFVELYPESVQISVSDDSGNSSGTKIYACKFSDGWFTGFRRRWRISYRVKTKIAQKTPEEARPLIEQWMRFNRRNTQLRSGEIPREVGRYYLCNMYNMDQTPLPFEFLDGRTYNFKGNKTVWVRALRSGWHKRQATLMVTVCADGVRRCDPLIIFRGEGVGTNVIAEQNLYHPGVRVEFNSKAYSNQDVTLRWILNDLKWATDYDLNLPRFCALDVFAGQKTPKVLKAFKTLNIVTSFIPEGCTSLVQPLDTAINKIFKDRISELIDEELDRNPEKWEEKAFNVSDRRVLVTHCVGEAWEWIHREKQDMIIKSFRQVGLTLHVDGSEDGEVKVKDLPNLIIGDWQVGGLDCNLNRDGKTGNGELNLSAHDEKIFTSEVTEQLALLAHEPEEEEYILENDSHTQIVTRDWAIRVFNHDSEDFGPGNGEQQQATKALMDLDFLCN